MIPRVAIAVACLIAGAALPVVVAIMFPIGTGGVLFGAAVFAMCWVGQFVETWLRGDREAHLRAIIRSLASRPRIDGRRDVV